LCLGVASAMVACVCERERGRLAKRKAKKSCGFRGLCWLGTMLAGSSAITRTLVTRKH